MKPISGRVLRPWLTAAVLARISERAAAGEILSLLTPALAAETLTAPPRDLRSGHKNDPLWAGFLGTEAGAYTSQLNLSRFCHCDPATEVLTLNTKVDECKTRDRGGGGARCRGLGSGESGGNHRRGVGAP